MNAFVRDGAVNRKRRVRPSSPMHRGIDPNRKKIRKTQHEDSTATQSDRLNFGESTVNQSTSMAIETEKESRYSNVDFIRAKAFVYLKFKKINPANVNKALKQHLKRFDKDETQLKKIFEQCYNLTQGSVKVSEAMMKQLETNTCVNLTNVSSRIRDRYECKEVVKKTLKRNNITTDKKLMSLSLKKRIDEMILMLFGKFNFQNDRKILYSNTILHTVPENDISHDNTCRITKSYSIRNTQHDSFRETKISKPNANYIVRENHISCINDPVNGVRKIQIPQLKIDGIVQNARNSVLETVHNGKDSELEITSDVGEIMIPQLRIDETIQNTKELVLEIVDDDDVGEIMSPRLIIDETVESIEDSELKVSEEITVPQLNTDKCVNNVKDSALKIASNGGEIMIPQLKIDETIQNTKELVLEIVDDDDVGDIMSPRLIIDETVESIEDSELKVSEEITVPQLNTDKCINNFKDSELEITRDVGEIMIPQLRIDETIQNTKELVLEIVDDDDVGEIMSPRLIIGEAVESIEDSELKISEEFTVPQLNTDKCINNVKDSELEITRDVGEIMIPQLRIDETIQNTKELVLEIVDDDDVGEIMSPRLIIGEAVESIEDSELKISEEFTVSQLNTDKCINNVKDSELEITRDVGEIMIPQLRIDETIQNTKELVLEIVDDDDVGEIMSPRLIIDETVESIEDSELKISEEITVPQLNTDKCVNNVKDSALKIASNGGEIMIPQLRIDETIQNTKELVLEIVDDDDVGEIMSPRLIIDETVESIEDSELKVSEEITVPQLNTDKCVNNVKDSALKIASNGGEIMIPQLKIDETIQNTKELVLEIVDDDDVGEIMSPRLIIGEAVESIEDSELKISEEFTVSQLNTDKCINNFKDSELEITRDVGEIMIPQLRIDETIQNTKELVLEIVDDDDVGEIMSPRLIIDETVESIEDSELKISEEITVPQLNTDKCVNNVKDSALKIASNGGEIMIPQLRIDETIQNTKELVLEIVDDDDVGEIMSPRLIIDETVESIEDSELKISEEITVPQLNTDKCVNNVKDSALKITSNGGEIMIPQLRIDETIQNTKELVLEIVDDDDVGEIMSPRLIIDETVESIEDSELKVSEEITVLQLNTDKCVNNVKDSALKIASNGGEIMIPQLKIDETIQNTKELVLEIVDDDDVGDIMSPRLIIDETVESIEESVLKIDEDITVPQLNTDKCVHNGKDSELEITSDVGEIMVPQLKIDGNIENTKSSALETNIDVVNEIENTNDMNQQPEILKHFINIVLKIGRLIDPEDEIFKNSIIKDLATYFLNDDFLSKVDTLFNTTESDLIGELIVKLLDMFNDSQFNMAPFSGCLISVFREIALKSSIPPCKMKLKLIVFLDAIKRYIRVHDYGLYRSWFLPSMFFDWCFFVAYIFMNTNKDFIIDLNKKSIIKNATLYYNMVKQSKYLFINQDSKPKKTLKKSGIFELTRIDDLLEIDDVHTKKSDNQVIPNISVNIPFKEPKHNELKMKNENCIETINLTNMADDEEKECPTPVNYNIYVNPKYNNSNSFIKPLDWFGFDVTELRNQLNATISNKSNESSIVQNNTINVDNNIQPIANNFGNVETSVKNKSRKRKKSAQVESPRVYFTVANNPKQFDLTFGSSVVTQSSSSSTNPQNTSVLTIPQNASQSRDPKNTSSSRVSPSSRSSQVPRKSSSSKNLRKLSSSTIPQYESLLSILQNPYSPTVSQNSLTFPQYTSFSTVPTNQSSYNNNLTNTQYPETLQTVINQSPYSPTVNQNSSSLTIPQHSSSSAVSQNASLLTIPQNPCSPTVHQNSSSLTIPQHSSSLAVPQCPRSSAVPQRPRSSAVPQDASLLTIPHNPYSSIVPTNRSSYYNNILSNTQYPETLQTMIPQSPYSSTVSQNTSLLTIAQNPYSPTVHQNSNSLTIPQHSCTSAVPQHLSPYYNNFSSNHTQIPIGFRKDSSISNTTQTSNSKSTLPVNNNLQSSITTLPPVSSNKWPQNLYHQSTNMNALCSMVANACSSNVSNTSNVNKNPCFENSCRHYAPYTPYMDFTQSDLQSLYNENIPFTTSQHSNAPTCTTNHMEPISRDLVRNTQTSEASINNAYIQKLNDKYNNFNYGSSLVNQNNLHTPEYNPQVSPDLPDARLPNMPNRQDSYTRNKTCMAANCTNISCFRCEICMAAFYCSTQCQTTDLHYHKNECQRF